jgi:hypothetical protein
LRTLPTALLPPFPARRWPVTYLRRRSLRPTSAATPRDLPAPPPPEPYQPRRCLPCPTGTAAARVLLAPPPHEPYRHHRPPSPTGAATPRILPEPPNPRSSSPARRQAPWEAARVLSARCPRVDGPLPVPAPASPTRAASQTTPPAELHPPRCWSPLLPPLPAME